MARLRYSTDIELGGLALGILGFVAGGIIGYSVARSTATSSVRTAVNGPRAVQTRTIDNILAQAM